MLLWPHKCVCVCHFHDISFNKMYMYLINKLNQVSSSKRDAYTKMYTIKAECAWSEYQSLP